jgi:hypothetical protein
MMVRLAAHLELVLGCFRSVHYRTVVMGRLAGHLQLVQLQFLRNFYSANVTFFPVFTHR